MSDEGFTKSYRCKWQNQIFRNLLEAGIWAWMCDAAAWKDCKVRFNGALFNLQRGQLVTSRRFISEGFCIGEQVTRTFLDFLENDKMINQLVTSKGTIITLCNYEKYQENLKSDNPQSNQPLTSSQPTANPLYNRDEELKNLRTKEKEAPLPEWMPLAEWEAFKKMRKKIRKPLTEEAEILAITKLEKFRAKGHDPTAILNYSILNDYPGIYEPKENSYARQSKDDRARAAVMRAAQAGGFAPTG